MRSNLSRNSIRLSQTLPLLILLVSGCETMDSVGSSIGDYTGKFGDLITGHTPRNAAVQMEDQYFADERRIGINSLSDRDWGRKDPYCKRYEQIAASDSDYMARATAIRALNRARWSHATTLFAKALDDVNPQVRLEAAKALSNVPDEKAAGMLVKLVANPAEPRDVRIAAADALRHYKTIEVERTLVGQLSGKEFGVAWQSRMSLVKLTGKDHLYDESAWLGYLTERKS
jgi:hypothetical protein